MKVVKISLLAILFFVAKNNYAQLEKGTKSIGGALSGAFGTNLYGDFLSDPGNHKEFNPNSSNFWIKVDPSFGYMIKKNWMLQLGADVGYSQFELASASFLNPFNFYESSTSKIYSQEYGINIGLRKYWMLPDSKFGFFVYGGVNSGILYSTDEINHYSFKYTTNESYYNQSTSYGHAFRSGLSFSPGISYMPTPRIALEATLGGLTYDVLYGEGGYIQHADIDFTKISIGFRYSFVKK
jgi:hypothetical protein